MVTAARSPSVGGSDPRIAWVSFDDIGRRCLEVSLEMGAPITAIVTLPGPADRERSGQVRFDDLADRAGACLIETANVNDPSCLERLRAASIDMAFVVGWSQLVREGFLSIARLGAFGMHPTLLPKHRGRAPIPWAILSGLARTGVTLFEIADPSADSGPIVGQVEVPISADDTATTLYTRISDAHTELLATYLIPILRGTAPRHPQDERRASSWPSRRPTDGLVDWETRAASLWDWVRAQTRPYPGAFTFMGDRKVLIWRARPVELEPSGEAVMPGTVLGSREGGVVVACGDGAMLLEEVEEAGSPPVSGSEVADLLRPGTRLG